MKYDFLHKGIDETLPPNEPQRMKYFSTSKKITRLRNGMNRHKTFPRIRLFELPYGPFFEVYGTIVKENKKRYAILPFID